VKDEQTLLDEAIVHAEEVAARECGTDCGGEHACLAMWLKELRDIKYPEKLPDEENVVSLDEHRIRSEGEFEDEQVAYVEALWGRESFAYNVAVRDLEAMRRGRDDGALRPPETYHEAMHMVLHVRALANDIARHFGLTDRVRSEDDEAVGRGHESGEAGDHSGTDH